MKNTIDKIFNKLENDIELRLNCFDNLISEGEFYIAEQKICDDKNHILEMIDDVKSWANEVRLYIRRINNDKFRPSYLIQLEEKLNEIFENGITKIDKRNKSEIESISICGEEYKLIDILNRISYFEKNVDESYVPTINRYLQNINDDINEGNRTSETWENIYNALSRERESIINMKNTVIRIRDDFLSDWGK